MNDEHIRTGIEKCTPDLKASLFKKIWNDSPDQICHAVLLLNKDGEPMDYIILDINPSMEKELGLSRDRVIGQNFTDIFPQQSPGWIRKCGEAVLSCLTLTTVEHNLVLDEWYEVQVFALDSENEFLTISRNITERKRAEKELRESEAEYKKLLNVVQEDRDKLLALLNSMTDEVWVADIDKKISMVNPQVLKEFGEISKGEEVEKIAASYEVYRPDGSPRPIDEAPLLRVLRGEIVRNEEEIVRTPSTNEMRYRQVNASPVKDANGYIIGSVSVVRDITNIKRAEEALRASEEKFRGIVETAGEGIAESDAEGRIVFVNKQMTGLLGYTENEFLSRTGLEFMAEDQLEQAYADRMNIDIGKKVEREYKLHHKDGSIVWTLCSAIPLFDESGQYLGNLAMHSDITRRKQIEEEKQALLDTIRIERDRLNIVIQNIPDEVWFVDNKGEFTTINQSAVQNFGSNYFGMGIEEMASSLEIYRPDGSPRPVDETPIIRALQGEEIKNFEEIVRNPHNNELRYRQVNAVPVRDECDNNIGAIAVVRDITEQRQAEKEYAMSRLDKISTLFVTNGDLANILNEILEFAISLTEADMGNILLLDDETGLLKLMAYHGFKQPFLDFFADVDHGIGSCGAALNRGEQVVVGDVTTSPIFAGTPALDVVLEAGIRAFQSTPLINRSGKLVGMLSTHFRSPHVPAEYDLQMVDLLAHQAADLIERMKAEEALRQSEERFSKIFINNPDMICIIDMDTEQFMDINPMFTEVLGYTHEDVIGQNQQELKYLMDSQQYDQEHKNGTLFSNEIMLRSKSGRLVNVLSSVGVVEINRKKQRIIIFKDITKEKMIETEMNRLGRLNLIGEMAASIGHEIRNPMTAVRGFLQILSSKPQYGDDQTYFDLMIEELDRANGIITEFLGMARDKMIDLQPCFLDHIVKSLSPMILSEANLREIDLVMDLNEPPSLLIDPNEIRQMILNMSRNAIEAMPSRGTLTIGTRQEGVEVVLYIKDEGKGIPKEFEEKLYTPFFTTKEKGTGLGLPVCFSIAVRHNARIDYETGKEGTTFYVRFPITD